MTKHRPYKSVLLLPAHGRMLRGISDVSKIIMVKQTVYVTIYVVRYSDLLAQGKMGANAPVVAITLNRSGITANFQYMPHTLITTSKECRSLALTHSRIKNTKKMKIQAETQAGEKRKRECKQHNTTKGEACRPQCSHQMPSGISKTPGPKNEPPLLSPPSSSLQRRRLANALCPALWISIANLCQNSVATSPSGESWFSAAALFRH